MFYEPKKNDHGLRYNPFKSIVVPRPIGWISSLSPEGTLNLAPFSQFNNLSFDPPMVGFSAAAIHGERRKDSARNAVETGEFVANMATWELREEVSITSQEVEPDVDEAALAGLEMIPSKLVKPPRVKRSPIHLECRTYTTLTLPGRLPGHTHEFVIGEVIGVHIADEALTDDGRIDIVRLRPLARLGYLDFTSVESSFTMVPPNASDAFRAGMSGTPKKDAAE